MRKHIADMQTHTQTDTRSGSCRCGEWRVDEVTEQEARQSFEAHKANPFPAPTYAELVALYYEAELSLVLDHGGKVEDHEGWLRDKCNAWLGQKSQPPLKEEK